MKKRTLALILSALMALTAIVIVPVGAYTNGEWEFTVQGDTATITRYIGSATEVTIPSTVVRTDGEYIYTYRVTAIGERIGYYSTSSFTSVTIPDSVTTIGGYAFAGSASLTSVTIPDGVITIGDYAFLSCTSLTSVVIPDSVTKLGVLNYNVFAGCTSLESVTIGNGVRIIKIGTFSGCTALTDITIGNGVREIESGSFDNTAYCNDESNWEDGVLYVGNYLIKAKTDIEGSYSVKPGTICIAG